MAQLSSLGTLGNIERYSVHVRAAAGHWQPVRNGYIGTGKGFVNG